MWCVVTNLLSRSIGKGNAGEPAERVGFVPGELPGEVLFPVTDKDAERFRTFREGEEISALELRWQTFQEVPKGILVHLCDATGRL